MSAAKDTNPDTGLVMSREEYRLWYEAQPRGRFERIDGRVVAMAAERLSHVIVKGNVYVELRRAIAASGVRCQALADGATVETGNSDYEPDALVNCGARIGGDELAAPSPVVVVEVLSPGTRSVDTGRKLAGYFAVPSVSHYLIVDPARRLVIHHRRTGDAIASAILTGGPVLLDPPGMTVELDAFYADA